MRTAFIETLCEMARVDPDVWLLCADLGFSVLETFEAEFPERYVNVGVAEQNMAGMAGGLALSGKTVVTYSISNFAIFRCLEQIRNDICYPSLNVKMVAVGAGFAYGSLGYSHHAVEDLAVMLPMPNLTLYSPADPAETRAMTREMLRAQGPVYLRLGKAGEAMLFDPEVSFDVGKARVVEDGADVAILTTGSMLKVGMEVASILRDLGVAVKLVNVSCLKPIDAVSIRTFAQGTRLMATIEEHVSIGGLHALTAGLLVEAGVFRRCLGFHADQSVSGIAGSREYLLDRCGLHAASIAARIRGSLEP